MNVDFRDEEKTVTMPMIWTQTNGKMVKENPIENIKHNYFFGFVFGKDFSDTATSFKHHTTNPSDMKLFYLFLCMLLACEDTENGALSVAVAKKTNKTKYDAIINAIALSKCGKSTKYSNALIKKYVVSQLRYEPEVQLDIIDAIDELKQSSIDQQNKKIQNTMSATERLSKKMVNLPPKCIRGLCFMKNKKISDDIPFYEDEIRGKMLNPYCDIIVSQFEIIDEDGNLFNRDEIEQIIQTGDKFIQKVELILTLVPKENDPSKNIGFLAHFIVRDSSWNPGKLLNKLNQPDLDNNYIFPQYIGCPTKDFPTKNFNFNKYIDIAVGISGHIFTADSIDEQFGRKDFEDYSNPLHLKSVLSLERAQSCLRQAKGNEKTISNFGASINMAEGTVAYNEKSYVLNVDQLFWYNRKFCGLYEFYFPWVEPENHTSILAINDKENVILDPLQIVAQQNMVPTREQVYQARPDLTSEENLSNNDLVKLRVDFKKVWDELEAIRPKNMLQTLISVQSLIKTHGVDNWKKYALRIKPDIEAYDAFIKIEKCVRLGFMNRFVDLCRLDGQNGSSSIPPQFKAILLWYSNYIDNCTEINTLTRDLSLTSPDIGFFGNSMIKILSQYSYVLNLTQPKYTAWTEGLFSIYEMDAGLRFNMLVLGAQATGKTHHINNFLRKYLIHGTWTDEDNSTAAADFTSTHIEMTITLKDEVDDIYTSAKAAKQNPKRTNAEKTKFTEGKLKTRFFKSVDDGNGNTHRKTETISTKHESVLSGTGNNVPEGETPMSSRLMVTTMKCSNISASEMNDVKSNENIKKKKETKTYVQRTQFFSAIYNQAMCTGAICPSIDMQLWDDMKNRIVDNLCGWTGTKINQTRILDIMGKLVRQYTIRKAWHHTYDIIGSPYYNKEFEISQLAEMSRVAYVTKPIIWWVLTLMSEQLVYEDGENVMKALHKHLNIFEDDFKKSPYEMYVNDKTNALKFKTTPNPNYDHNNRDSNPNRYNVDLNYWQIDSSIEELANLLSPLTDPVLKSEYVVAVLMRMSDITFTPKTGLNNRNGYGSIGCDDLARHKYANITKIIPSMMNLGEQLKIFSTKMGIKYKASILDKITGLHPSFINNPDATQQIMSTYNIDNSDLIYLKLSGKENIHCDDLKTTAKSVYENKGVNDLDQKDLKKIIDSLIGIKKIGNKTDAERFNNNQLTYKDAILLLHGFEIGYFLEIGTERSVYKKTDENTCENDIPMLRNVTPDLNTTEYHSITGLIRPSFNHKTCVYISPMLLRIFNRDIVLDGLKEASIMESTKPEKFLLGWPTKENSAIFQTSNITQEFIDSVVEQYEGQSMSRKIGIPFRRRTHQNPISEKILREPGLDSEKHDPSFQFISKNMGREAAERQHVASGYSVFEPVYDPDFLKQRYINAGGKIGNVSYPDSLLVSFKNEMKETDRGFATGSFLNGRNIIANANVVQSLNKKRKLNENDNNALNKLF